jgi:CHRD domain
MRMHWSALASALAVVVAAATPASAEPPAVKNFVAHLSGDEEVPARATLAQGQAIFRLSEDGSTLSYKLIVANVENVVASHIHLGVFGVNGPVVAFLAGPFAPGGGRVDGVIAEGSITAANLVGPLAGQSLSVLVAAMTTGGTYVNAHTNDGVDGTNTGAGDFPGGEIRGQIRAAGPNP